MALLSAFTIPLFNVLSVVALTVYVGQESEADVQGRVGAAVKGILRNPLIIGVLAGIGWVLLKPLVGQMSPGVTAFWGNALLWARLWSILPGPPPPWPCWCWGGQFEINSVRSLRKQIRLGVLGRLFLAPLLGIGGAVLLQGWGILQFDNGIFAALISLFATPAAVASAVMAEEMDNDGQLAGQLVVWTTLLSAGVIFGAVALLRGLGLV